MALTSLAGKTAAAWVDTSGATVGTSIKVGVRGGSYEVQYHLGATPGTPDKGIYAASKASHGVTTLDRASAVRVVNTGTKALGYEVSIISA